MMSLGAEGGCRAAPIVEGHDGVSSLCHFVGAKEHAATDLIGFDFPVVSPLTEGNERYAQQVCGFATGEVCDVWGCRSRRYLLLQLLFDGSADQGL